MRYRVLPETIRLKMGRLISHRRHDIILFWKEISLANAKFLKRMYHMPTTYSSKMHDYQPIHAPFYKVFFTSGFPTEILYEFINLTMRITCAASLTPLHLSL
jgi:hypothetical protein